MKSYRKIKKNPALIFIVLLLSGFAVQSQEAIEVKIIQAQMSKGLQTCYSADIPQADLKTVQQNWIKKLQENNKAKVKEAGQELLVTGTVKKELTGDSINIYSLIIQKDSLISLNVFVEIDSVFFSPKEDKTDLASDKIDSSIKNYLRSFAVDQYKLAVSEELKSEEKTLSILESDLEKLEKEQGNLEKDISSLENDIEEKERQIKEIDQDIDLKRQDLLAHNASMLTLVGEEEKKAAKERQKELEKEKNQLEKNRSKAKDDISSFKSKIDKNKKAIEDSISGQEEKSQEITAQKEVISAVEAKLAGIK